MRTVRRDTPSRLLSAAVDVRRPGSAPTRPRHAGRVPRWSVLLFVVVFAAVVALVLANREREDDRAPAARSNGARPRPRRPPARAAADRGPARRHPRGRLAGRCGDRRLRRAAPAGGRIPRFAAALPRAGLPRDHAAAAARRRPRRAPDPHAPVLARRHGAGRVRAAGLGCADDDFDALQDGEVALIERGTCFFRDKALNAERAGAAAALIVDQEREPVAASLQRPGWGSPCSRSGPRPATGSRAARRP